MSTIRAEFFKAARETPRLFFAPIVGVVEAVAREFRALDDSEEKKKKKKYFTEIVIRRGRKAKVVRLNKRSVAAAQKAKS